VLLYSQYSLEMKHRTLDSMAKMRGNIHDGPEHNTLQSEAGYIEARPLTATSAKPLATHGRTIH
jgi:hypothetical protein